MNRRRFLRSSASAALVSSTSRLWPSTIATAPQPEFRTSNQRWQAAYDKALAILSANVRVLPRVDAPVLIEGSEYGGIWQECGPHESLVYSPFRPDVARNSHMTFFKLQREDGQLPANNKQTEAGFGQIQMVVPIAATAWELAQRTGDHELLEAAYTACVRWDDWLMRYRNTRGTGLIEGFCTYDTGHDNSPRWSGMPVQCPDKDARRCPANSSLPRLCPDLSATVYGGRRALAEMALALNKNSEANQWKDKAEHLQRLILAKLYVPEEGAFYDLDPHDAFVRVRSDVISRVCGEHVVDQPTFDSIWKLQLGNPAAFWAPFPLPSIAMNDPTFQGSIPKNSWGGPSQALTALRAVRWLGHYGKHVELAHLMERWCEAIQADLTFRQQINPETGVFGSGDLPNYSPAALLLYDFTWRLSGITEEAGKLRWNIRPGLTASEGAEFVLPLRNGHSATLRYTRHGAELSVGSSRKLLVEGGTVAVITSLQGAPESILGVANTPQSITLHQPGKPSRPLRITPNQFMEALHLPG
jgi:hypothetical protein